MVITWILNVYLGDLVLNVYLGDLVLREHSDIELFHFLWHDNTLADTFKDFFWI
jgi:hypothetical protein